MLLILSLGWATIQTGRFLLSPLLPRISSDLGLSPGEIGLTITALALVYALAQYPSGTYSDMLSRATLLVPAFVVLLAGITVIGLAVRWELFVIGAILLGFGKGLYASPSRAMIGDLFTARQGRALGVFAAGTDLGGLIAAGLGVVVLATATWRVAFVPVFCALIVVTAAYLRWNRDPYELRRVRLSPSETLGRIVATRTQRKMVVAFSLFYLFVGGIVTFFPMLLVDGGFSETVAGLSFALLFAVGLLMKPLVGDVSDRLPRISVSIFGLVIAAVGTILIVLAPTLSVVTVGTILTAIGYKTLFPIIDAVIMDAASAETVGTDLGAARAIFLTSSAAGPGTVGVIADITNFGVAFLSLATGLLLGAYLLARQ